MVIHSLCVKKTDDAFLTYIIIAIVATILVSLLRADFRGSWIVFSIEITTEKHDLTSL